MKPEKFFRRPKFNLKIRSNFRGVTVHALKFPHRVRPRSQGLHSSLNEGRNQMKAAHYAAGSLHKLDNLLHQGLRLSLLSGRYLVQPSSGLHHRRVGIKIRQPFLLGAEVEPFLAPVLHRIDLLDVEVLDLLASLDVEAANSIHAVRAGVPLHIEDLFPKTPMRVHPRKHSQSTKKTTMCSIELGVKSWS